MPEEPKEIGRFALGIKLLRHGDGRVEYGFQSKNMNIPLEIILMQVRAWLRNQENNYFDNFDRNTTKGDYPSDDGA